MEGKKGKTKKRRNERKEKRNKKKKKKEEKKEQNTGKMQLTETEELSGTTYPMLQIVAMPVQERESTPGPKYSTMAPVPPFTVRMPATFRIISFGAVQPDKAPVSFTPTKIRRCQSYHSILKWFGGSSGEYKSRELLGSETGIERY